MIKHLEYLNNLNKIITDIIDTQSGNTEKTASAFADALSYGHNIFLFGTGHSSLLAQEIFYRAGGLVNIRPVLDEDLMLHISASESTEKERLPGYADKLFSEYKMASGDVIVIISNSGRNGAAVDLALKCKENGITVVALTNIAHSSSGVSRHKSGKRLFEIADIVLDNKGCIGDASVYFEELNRKAAPTSTAAGAAILNAVVAGCIEEMIKRGIVPEVFSSSNVDGGDEINAEFLKKYKNIVRSL